MPGTLARSSPKAQRTYAKVMQHAEAEYGKGERAGRTAYGALKHGFEKVGDHWEEKAAKGPSDARSAAGAGDPGLDRKPSAGGVDARGHSRAELQQRARGLGVVGLSRMNKTDLAQAIARKEKSASRRK
jgi:hypothetical protein